MHSSKNRIFTAADIERYHAGELPVEEMHALEKAALDDPFLADALEGYQYTTTPTLDLQLIRERLAEKKEKKRVVPFYRSAFFRAAAVVLLVAAFGWLAMTLFTPASSNLAIDNTKTPAPTEEKPTANQVQKAEIGDSNTQVEIAPLNSIASEKKPQAKREKSPEKIAAVPTQETITVRSAFTNSETKWTSDSVSNSIVSSGLPERSQVVISPRPLNQDYGFQSRNLNMNRNRAMPELEENYSNQRRASERNLPERSFDSFQNRQQALDETVNNNFIRNDTIRNVDVVLKKDTDNPPAEVVVLSKGVAKAKKPTVVVDTLEPAEGVRSFDEYIANNLREPEEIRIKNITGGEVQLSFDVNRKGEPVNITVVKSLCEKCDEEAVRLLKEGPRWKKNRNKKGRITIRF